MNKKTPNDYPQVKFRTGKDLEAEFASRSDEQSDSVFSRIAKRDLERYYTLLPGSLPTFTEGEAIILVNALNGAKYPQPEQACRLYVDVQEYLEESEAYSQKPVNDDAPALVFRVKEMSPIECMAIIDAAERFWSGAYHQFDIHERLKKVGLIKGE